MVKLSCRSCGAKLELTDDIDQFSCANCGTEWAVNRSGGIVSLRAVDEHVGGTILYQLNQRHYLYPELKSIIAKTLGVEGGMRDALGLVPGIKCAFIFGSFALGEEHEGSDIDLFIIGAPDFDELGDLVRQQEDVLNREINYHVYSEEEWNEKRSAQEGFILNLMEKPKIFLIGDEKCL